MVETEEALVEPDIGRALAALRRFAEGAAPRERKPAAGEHCDLCAAPVPDDHRHMLEMPAAPAESVAGSSLRCVCRSCTVLFSREAAQRRYRLIPDRRLRLPDLGIDDLEWQAWRIPVGLAFLTPTSSGPVIATYPGAAGPVSAAVDEAAWEELRQRNPVLATLEPDVEALLINRVRDARRYYVVPLDDCYRLVGLVRNGWQGMTGGAELWTKLDRFFGEMDLRTGIPRS